ncbi:hypothetical protein ECG_07530 [Echinococcus granulosus]|uniref:Uncharacterized protein n=1 Tax=Echinococcus granulosus TaxID=6210 RepID=W6UHC5_ECHGR|nr:hypothetical protein EGR_07709 [Echinococcus granulosus]EUB57467.1 hypothetical protein EGR_07709 [Echinococcus granulosus]KAH9279445.1 hypothetical protein ECG_07530 [Echinococcus granulosus]
MKRREGVDRSRRREQLFCTMATDKNKAKRDNLGYGDEEGENQQRTNSPSEGAFGTVRGGERKPLRNVNFKALLAYINRLVVKKCPHAASLCKGKCYTNSLVLDAE